LDLGKNTAEDIVSVMEIPVMKKLAMIRLSSAMRSCGLLTMMSSPTTALDVSPVVMPILLTALVMTDAAIIRTAT
jgi:hypothetical protein